MLTKRQSKTLAFIHEYITKKGYGPSYDEIKDAMGWASKSRVFYVIKALEERGFVEKLQDYPRSVKIQRMPQADPIAETILSFEGEYRDKLLEVHNGYIRQMKELLNFVAESESVNKRPVVKETKHD